MGFDGLLVPDWAKPYIGWVVGMDWPEGDETGCFRLADACVTAAHRIVEGTAADQPWTADKIGSEWDGAAHLAFAEHVGKMAGQRVAGLVNRLVDTAVALNGVGVQIQYAKYMIEVTVWLLIAQLAYLLAAAIASGGASLALIPPRVQLARMTVAQIAKRALLNIAMFAGIVAGMDAGIQLTQMAQGRRDAFDLKQLGISALSGGAMGGLMGLMSGGLTRLATPALRAGLSRAEMSTAERLLAAASSSLYGQAAQYAVTGGITTAGTMLVQGNFSWDLLAKGITSSALGADGQHLTTALPNRGGGTPSPYGDPSSAPHDGGPGPEPRNGSDPGPRNDPDPAPGDRPDPELRTGSDPGPRNDADPAPGDRPDPELRTGSDPGLRNDADPASGDRPDPAPDRGAAPRVEPVVGPGLGSVPDRGTTLSQATTDTAPGAGSETVRQTTAPQGLPHGADEARPQAVPQQGPAPVRVLETPRPRTSDQSPPSAVRNTPEYAADGTPRRSSERQSGGAPHQTPDRATGGAPPHQVPDRTGGGMTQQAAERGPTGAAAATGVRGNGADPAAPARQGAPGETPPVSRIERLLNHVSDAGETTPPTRTAGRADQTGDGTSPPAQAAGGTSPPPLARDGAPTPSQAGDRTPPPSRPGDTSPGASQDGPGGSRNSSSSRAPFDFERFYNDPRWLAEATRFEQRLGAYYFNDPQTVDAACVALGRLRDVLLDLTPRQPGESPSAFARRVESAFFNDDPANAGQVGTRTGVTVDDLLAHGNLRELVTAFYNGAYYNRANPNIFGNALLDIMDTGGWDRAREAGLDVGEVRRAQHQLDERWHRPALGRLEARFMPDRYTFNRDPFGTGNVGMLSERGARDVAEMVSSQFSRRDRTETEIQDLNTTPGHYDRLGAPLGRFERAFVEEHLNGRADPDTLLPWREGVTMHDTTGSRWARRIAGEGFPVVDGVSGTTAKMLTAVKFLNLGPSTTEHFLGALMGWMLPGLDHSLFEIARGAQIADVGGMRLEPGSRPNMVDFYRSLPGVDLSTLRGKILPDGMFPHESRYFAHATDRAGFSETQHSAVRYTLDYLWSQLEQGRVTARTLAEWLDGSGINPRDRAAVRALGDRLSPAHLMALSAYAMEGHHLINNMTRTQLWTGGLSESLVRHGMVSKVSTLVGNYLNGLAVDPQLGGLPIALNSLVRVDDHYLKMKPPKEWRPLLTPMADSYVDAVRRKGEAKERFEQARDKGNKQEAREAGQDLRAARKDAKDAWKALEEQLGRATPGLLDEMRWHTDMLYDAMAQLPMVGSPERPVWAYRGDWMTPVHSPIYGSTLHPHGTTREFLSMSRQLEVAIKFMVERTSRDRKVLVAYQLTGQQAKDMSVFSPYFGEKEIVFPPHSRVRRVDDPELVASLRAEVDALAADAVVRGVISEVPRYEIIVMEEG